MVINVVGIAVAKIHGLCLCLCPYEKERKTVMNQGL